MEKNIEYNEMAVVYDKFYQNKNYEREVFFIEEIIDKTHCKILDVGCGTGTHLKLLFDKGYDVFGIDLNEGMIDIANTKIPNHFAVANLLDYKTDVKYDAIISFFAVFNHLKGYDEFSCALNNLKHLLYAGVGTIIIDLHNPQSSGKKIQVVDDMTRIMQWRVCKILQKEYSTLTYEINSKKHITKHTFKIFKMNKIKKIAYNLGFKSCEFFENYDKNVMATELSKNIQVVLKI